MAKTWKQQRAEIQAAAEAAGKVTVIKAQDQKVTDLLAKAKPSKLTNEQKLIKKQQIQARETSRKAREKAKDPKTEADLKRMRKRAIDRELKRDRGG